MQKLNLKINPEIQKLAALISKKFNKAEVFLVGGAVRDLLLTEKSKDYDLLVRGVPGKNLGKFLKTLGSVNLVGKNVGVYKFKPKKTKLGREIDIALPRTEYSVHHSGAYKDFKIKTNWHLNISEDLSRRDFTVNALAWNIENGELSDPYGGLDDLKKKVIRAVGKPEKRFSEDYSRMLRALRFSCQLNFQIEKKTWQTIKKLNRSINKKFGKDFIVPRETIAKEILKSFHYNPTKALELLDNSGLLKELMPELLKMKGCPQPDNWHAEGDVWQHTLLTLKILASKKFVARFPRSLSINVIMAALFHDLGKPFTIKTPEKHGTDRIRFNEHDLIGAKIFLETCQRLKLTSYKDEKIDCDCQNVFWLIRNHMIGVNKKSVNQMKNTTLEKYFFSDKPGNELLQLMYADVSATVPQNGRPAYSNFNLLNRRLQKLSGSTPIKPKNLARPLLTGKEIMKIAKIKPGPKVGEIISLLREEQLKGKITSKKGAEIFVKKISHDKKY